MISISEIRERSVDLAAHVDVLIQHSENYYALSQAVAEARARTGDRARMLTRQAVGSEIVSRLYRLIKNDSDAWNYPWLINHLKGDELLEKLMPTFNHDGRKTFRELVQLRDEVLSLFDKVASSLEFQKLSVYRQKFVGHRVPKPRDLRKFSPEADVVELSSSELRWLTDVLSVIADRTAYMIDRSSFPADQIAHMAQDEAHALWDLPAPENRKSLKDVYGQTD
ncbi:hypothetical protein [Oceanicaulis alexandrii]|uniref:hypothetical protein n=1 Tax=Oceanicaulis alexandrii TaxID=153233 RepID=UPI002352B273|nr:hypothetical protein [Oceanicaulis alexandrii]